MWTVVVSFVLVCGYIYINSHTPSKIEIQKAQGWNAYFQVALKGCEFLIGGFFIAAIINIALYLVMFILNIPLYLGCKYEAFYFATAINEFRFFTISFFSWLIGVCTVLISIGQASKAKKEEISDDKKLETIKAVAEKNAINKLLLESIESNLFIMITLKSRKVYVGMVDATNFFNIYTNTSQVLSIIPFISGYRDKDTLSFVANCNYANIYQEQNISFDSSPLSFEQFRHLIPMEQVESLSLVDADTFIKFNKKQT